MDNTATSPTCPTRWWPIVDKLVVQFKEQAAPYFLPKTIRTTDSIKACTHLMDNATFQLEDLLQKEPPSLKIEIQQLLKRKIMSQLEELSQKRRQQQQDKLCKRGVELLALRRFRVQNHPPSQMVPNVVIGDSLPMVRGNASSHLRQHITSRIFKQEFLKKYRELLDSEKYIIDILTVDLNLVHEAIVAEIKGNFLQQQRTKSGSEISNLWGRELLNNFHGAQLKAFYANVEQVKSRCFVKYERKLLDETTKDNMTVSAMEEFYTGINNDMTKEFIDQAMRGLPISEPLVALLQPHVIKLQDNLNIKYKQIFQT